MVRLTLLFFFFFNDTATTEIYTLSLHDALPIFTPHASAKRIRRSTCLVPDSSSMMFSSRKPRASGSGHSPYTRSEEHTSELQSQSNLVCRLLLETKTLHAKHVSFCSQM